jgi:integrase
VHADIEAHPKGRNRPDEKNRLSHARRSELLLDTSREHFPRYYPFFLLLARTGLRIGEAMALQWEDIDFHGRFIEVRRTLYKNHISTPKNGKTRRVDMSQQLTNTFKALLLERKKETL